MPLYIPLHTPIHESTTSVKTALRLSKVCVLQNSKISLVLNALSLEHFISGIQEVTVPCRTLDSQHKRSTTFHHACLVTNAHACGNAGRLRDLLHFIKAAYWRWSDRKTCKDCAGSVTSSGSVLITQPCLSAGIKPPHHHDADGLLNRCGTGEQGKVQFYEQAYSFLVQIS